MKRTGQHRAQTAAAVVLFFCGTLLSGCSALTDAFSGEGPFTAGTETQTAPALAQSADPLSDHLSMEDAAVLDYAVPTQLPSVLVDKEGYSAGQQKIIYVKLDPMRNGVPSRYSIVENETGRTVFQGTLESALGERTYEDGRLDYTLRADLGKDLPEGEYRVECAYYGSSYPFRVGKHLLRDRFESVAADLSLRLGNREVSPDTVLYMLQSYEWGEDFFASETETLGDPLEGAAFWIRGIDYGNISAEEASVYAALLAKFGYLYKSRDGQLATECLQKASSLYSQSRDTLQRGDLSFWALTELYRASGQSTYHDQILEYKDTAGSRKEIMDETGYLFGTMTYLVTRQSVDTNLCNALMKRLLAKGQELGELRSELYHPVFGRSSGESDLLRACLQLMCANHVLEGYEYNGMLEELLHYLSGRNIESAVYDTTGARQGEYYLLLSRMAALENDGLL